MAEKSLIVKEKFEHSGYFEFKSFYSHAHDWLSDEGFGVVEDKYSEKVSGNSRDILFEWSVTKKLSDYFQISLKLEFDITGLSDVEVETDGVRKKMNKGNVSGEFKGALVIDPGSKWERSPFNKFLRDIYNKYVVPKRVKNMEDEVFKAATDLKEELKAFLELSGRR